MWFHGIFANIFWEKFPIFMLAVWWPNKFPPIWFFSWNHFTVELFSNKRYFDGNFCKMSHFDTVVVILCKLFDRNSVNSNLYEIVMGDLTEFSNSTVSAWKLGFLDKNFMKLSLRKNKVCKLLSRNNVKMIYDFHNPLSENIVWRRKKFIVHFL